MAEGFVTGQIGAAAFKLTGYDRTARGSVREPRAVRK